MKKIALAVDGSDHALRAAEILMGSISQRVGHLTDITLVTTQ